jgi:hypothetical protein
MHNRCQAPAMHAVRAYPVPGTCEEVATAFIEEELTR